MGLHFVLFYYCLNHVFLQEESRTVFAYVPNEANLRNKIKLKRGPYEANYYAESDRSQTFSATKCMSKIVCISFLGIQRHWKGKKYK